MKRISNPRQVLMLASTTALMAGGVLLPATAFAAAPATPHTPTAAHRDGNGPGPDDGSGNTQVPNRPGPDNPNYDDTQHSMIYRIYAPWLYRHND
ncbi:hypothetical protein [Streptomyces fodineus]|uniref:hypothetical protein n=1 Tax=Streptomyces fodineus TaxID=1904616 RepID=UPI00131B5EDB|nr:hypothetical protein [Streptomyces fodineus]